MISAVPLYNDWIQQQIRVQSEQLALFDLTADRPFSWRQFIDRGSNQGHVYFKGRERLPRRDRVSIHGASGHL